MSDAGSQPVSPSQLTPWQVIRTYSSNEWETFIEEWTEGFDPPYAAIYHFDGTNWTSEGWWTIAPKACNALLNGPLQGRYYYLYASDGAAGTWEGKTHFCVAPDKRFKSVGRGSCTQRGFDSRGFFEVDTGKKPDWTQSLSN